MSSLTCEPPLEASAATPPPDRPDDLLTADEDLDRVLSTPSPSVESVRLEDSAFRRRKIGAGGDRKRLWMLLGALALPFFMKRRSARCLVALKTPSPATTLT